MVALQYIMWITDHHASLGNNTREGGEALWECKFLLSVSFNCNKVNSFNEKLHVKAIVRHFGILSC